MKVILTENVPGTGKKGQSLEIKDGFARNYLIPKGLAVEASSANLKRFEHIVKDLENKKTRSIKSAEDMKAKLAEITLIIKKKAGVDGKLFGSVTHKDVADAIEKALKVSIDKRLIKFEEPIKMTGAYTVDIHLSEGVNGQVKVEVEHEA